MKKIIFILLLSISIINANSIQTGAYHVISKHSGECLDLENSKENAKLVTRKCEKEKDTQKFFFDKQSSNKFLISSLKLPLNSKSNGLHIFNMQESDDFIVEKNRSSFKIRIKKTNKYLTVKPYSNEVIQFYGNDTKEQKWTIIKNLEDIDNKKFTSCKEILDSGKSTGDGVYTISLDNKDYKVYCDMTNNEGGWTLIASYPKTQTAIARILSYGDEPETNPSNPTKTWMYKGDLSNFNDVREQISCTGENNCKTVYGHDLSLSDLQKIRYSWGYNDGVEYIRTYANVPSCSKNYEKKVNDVKNCVNDAYRSHNKNTTILGWQVDIWDNTHCWAGRGSGYSSRGSGLCNRINPNGTRWSLLWYR